MLDELEEKGMPDDVKKILSDLENGKLPDIKKSSGNKELTKVRYNRSCDNKESMTILEYTVSYSISDPERQTEQDDRCEESSKKRKKSKPEGEQ